MKRNALVFVALMVAILAMLASGKYLERNRKHGHVALVGNVQGRPAPDFSLLTVDGTKAKKLSDYRGSVVLLNFWATWCPPCKVEMPWFADLQTKYAKDGLVVLGVAMDDSKPAQIQQFADEMGVNYPVLMGTDKVSDDFGSVQDLPTTFYIARDGTIVDKMVGLPQGKQEIEDAIKKALSPSVRSTTPPQQSQADAEVKSSPDKDSSQ